MSEAEIVLLDTGVIGQIAHPRADPAIVQWLKSLLARGAQVVVPEICDYELRRELIRADLTESLNRLDRLEEQLSYIPLSTGVMRTACELWADVRNRLKKPTADDKALDGDVILAAQARHCNQANRKLVVATTNVGHLSLLVDAREWQTIL